MPNDIKAAPSNQPATERSDIKKFTDDKQNTHDKFLTASIGMLLLSLYNTYLGKPKPADNYREENDGGYGKVIFIDAKHTDVTPETEKLFTDFVQEIHARADVKTDTSLQAAIKYIENIADQKHIPNHHDTFTIIFNQNNNVSAEQHVFRLRLLLPLVWQAINDDKKYSHHYGGSQIENEKQAKKDKALRIETFFNCLREIYTEQRCSQGNRHRLALTLNETYEGVHIIEHAPSTVAMLLREALVTAINQRITPRQIITTTVDIKDNKQVDNVTFKQAVIAWMRPVNYKIDALQLFKLSQPELLRETIFQHFSAHGYAVRTDVNNMIENALTKLEFSAHPKTLLYQMHAIFNYVVGEQPSAINKALTNAQRWLETCDWSTPENQLKICGFFTIYELYHNLTLSEKILDLAGNKPNDYDALLQTCQTYFNKCQNNNDYAVTSQTLDDKERVDTLITQANASCFKDQIQNFFWHWFDARETNDKEKIKKYYSLLMNENFQKNIYLTDAVIPQHFKPTAIDKKSADTKIDIDAYEVNRFLLNAILTDPKAWTPLFVSHLKNIMEFITNNFNTGARQGIANSLKRESYPDNLITQIKYLIALYEFQKPNHDSKLAEPRRPEDLPVLLPLQFQTHMEWSIFLITYLPTERLELYVRYQWHVQPLLIRQIDKIILKNPDHQPIHTLSDRLLNIIIFNIPSTQHCIPIIKLTSAKNSQIFWNIVLSKKKTLLTIIDSLIQDTDPNGGLKIIPLEIFQKFSFKILEKYANHLSGLSAPYIHHATLTIMRAGDPTFQWDFTSKLSEMTKEQRLNIIDAYLERWWYFNTDGWQKINTFYTTQPNVTDEEKRIVRVKLISFFEKMDIPQLQFNLKVAIDKIQSPFIMVNLSPNMFSQHELSAIRYKFIYECLKRNDNLSRQGQLTTLGFPQCLAEMTEQQRIKTIVLYLHNCTAHTNFATVFETICNFCDSNATTTTEKITIYKKIIANRHMLELLRLKTPYHQILYSLKNYDYKDTKFTKNFLNAFTDMQSYQRSIVFTLWAEKKPVTVLQNIQQFYSNLILSNINLAVTESLVLLENDFSLSTFFTQDEIVKLSFANTVIRDAAGRSDPTVAKFFNITETLRVQINLYSTNKTKLNDQRALSLTTILSRILFHARTAESFESLYRNAIAEIKGHIALTQKHHQGRLGRFHPYASSLASTYTEVLSALDDAAFIKTVPAHSITFAELATYRERYAVLDRVMYGDSKSSVVASTSASVTALERDEKSAPKLTGP